MEIVQTIPFRLDSFLKIGRHMPVRCHVEEDGASIPDQSIRPAGNDAGASDTGEWVHPEPTQRACKHQTRNDQDRNSGIRHDMDDCGPHIVVAVSMVVAMFMAGMFMLVDMVIVMRMVVMMMVVTVLAAAEEPSADQVYDQADTSNWDGLREMDRYGREKPANGIIADQ